MILPAGRWVKCCETLNSVCDCNCEQISARMTCTDLHQKGKKAKGEVILEVEQANRG